ASSPRSRAFPTTAGLHLAMDASGRDIPVLFLKQPEPGVHVAVGHLEQARRAAAALVNDAVALRQREDVVLVPSDGVPANLALARAFHHAADGVGGGAERKRDRAGSEVHQGAKHD